MAAHGHTRWAIAGGHIPLNSTGHEPEFTSRDQLYILNASDDEAHLRLMVYFTDREPIGPYELKVAAQRLRQFSFNDLIDPQPIPLATDYACILESDVPVIVQFSRRDTSQPANAIATMMAFHSD